jgi:hypothetical protein
VIAIGSFPCLRLGSRDRRDHGQLSLGGVDFAGSMLRLPLTEAVVATGCFLEGEFRTVWGDSLSKLTISRL